MKYIFKIFGLFIIILSLCVINSCKKDKPKPPVLTTTAVTEISYTTATSGGEVTNEGGAHMISRGICWNISAVPTITNSKTAESSGLGAFTSYLTQLTPNTMYYVRAYANNNVGTGYGDQVTFTTSQVAVPVLTTIAITTITQTRAVSGGNITADNGGSVTARGVCWGTATNPTTADSITTDGTGAGSFVSNLTGLHPGTIYYVRAYATNSVGTSYGNAMLFTTQNYGTVSDIDGNIYKTITIGIQVWIAENLKTIKYNDGTAIPLVTDDTAWAALSTPGYCWYNNDSATYKATYGALYNWFTVNTGKLCPMGWHVPSDAEWTILTTFLGGVRLTNSNGAPSSLPTVTIAGGKLKETGTTHWQSPNTGATNESGFTALPGGNRSGEFYNGGIFSFIGFYGDWWSSTENGASGALPRHMDCSSSNVYFLADLKRNGYSVRCIKDN